MEMLTVLLIVVLLVGFVLKFTKYSVAWDAAVLIVLLVLLLERIL